MIYLQCNQNKLWRAGYRACPALGTSRATETELKRVYSVSPTYAAVKCRVFNEWGGDTKEATTICYGIDFQIAAVSFRAHASSRMSRKGLEKRKKKRKRTKIREIYF
jgi:hypothetical protein